MDLKNLRSVITLAEEGHFGRAAARLNIVPSALSMQIRALEDELGGPLFVRTTRSLQLTQAGRALVETGRDLLARAEQLEQQIKRHTRGETGHLRIGFTASQSLAGQVVTQVRAFRQRYPGVLISLDEMPPEQQVAALRNGEIDLGYFADMQPCPSSLCVHQRWPIQWVLLLSADHPLAAQPQLDLPALAGQQFAVYMREDGEECYLDHLPAALINSLPPVRRVSSAIALLTQVAAGLALTLSPTFEALALLPGLVARPIELPGLPAHYVLASKTPVTEPLVQTFIDLI